MATKTMGKTVSRVKLVLQQGADRNFDVVWRDPTDVPVPIASVVSQIRVSAGSTVILDIGARTTVDADGHTMHVVIPASATATLSPLAFARWSFEAVATSGERKVLMEGPVRIEPAISV